MYTLKTFNRLVISGFLSVLINGVSIASCIMSGIMCNVSIASGHAGDCKRNKNILSVECKS